MSDHNDKIENRFDVFEGASLKELLYIKEDSANTPNVIFYKKYKAILRGHEKSFTWLITNVTELACNHDPHLYRYQKVGNNLVRIGSRKIYKRGIAKTEKIKAKIEDWEDDLQIEETQKVLEALDALSKAYAKIMQNDQGNKPLYAYKEIAKMIKEFWKDDLGHKKFFYDNGKETHDKANEFAEDFLRVIFDFDNTRGLKEALRELSDTRDS